MNLKGFILMLSFIAFGNKLLFSQNKIIDRLLLTLKIAKEDTIKLNTLNDPGLYSRYINIEIKQAIQYPNSSVSRQCKIS